MKTGIVRRIDDLGRVVIPKEIRDKLDIHMGAPLEISVEGNKVCFELYQDDSSFRDMVSRLSVYLRNHPIGEKKDEYIIGKLNDIFDCLDYEECE